jgi:ethanolamine ammonia-lyase small subunit
MQDKSGGDRGSGTRRAAVAVAHDAVAAGVEDEWLARGVAVEVDDLADQDHVIAREVDGGEAAVEPAGDTVEEWCACRADVVGHVTEGAVSPRPCRRCEAA